MYVLYLHIINIRYFQVRSILSNSHIATNEKEQPQQQQHKTKNKKGKRKNEKPKWKKKRRRTEYSMEWNFRQ